MRYARRVLKEFDNKALIDQGDCENLSQYVPYKFFDYVIDVESSFYYPDKDRFLSEVAKVLKDDGLFVYAFYT